MDDICDRINRIEVRESAFRSIKSYVLRNNTLTEKDRMLLDEVGEKYTVFFEKGKTDFRKFFPDDKPLIIEIGFGMGTTTFEIARSRSQYNYLAIEVYLRGYLNLLRLVSEEKLTNIRLMRFNAEDVLTYMCNDGSIEGFHIFFPDPWPKKKHHKRRLVNKEFLELLVKKLKKDGYIYFVTDWKEYAEEVLSVSKEIKCLYSPESGLGPKTEWRGETKFEKKGLEKKYEISEILLKKE